MLYSIIIVIGKLGVPLSYKYIIEGDLLKSALFNQGLEAGWKISFSLNKYFLSLLSKILVYTFPRIIFLV
jgi:hypothetical protein